ncbi:GAP family protein [Cellulomonas sp. DKR-3]|uniref:GAP family protein n=1 Tax=Cellulomonas fulva TaxID=2835530 RepID=A0ABS5U2B2_9CELL|nr:GAP family protein [Cellulomonas fulva]MBT0995551.1 GAP family protein [Cellulomonas fulva]
MNGVLGALLPLAVGVAISPIPIIAAILMLLSPRASSTSLGFLTGWIAGILVVATVFTLLSSALPSDDAGPATWVGVVKIVLGAALLLMAYRQWKSRPAPGEPAATPKWMGAIDSFTFGKALGLGALLSGVNPKNLLLGASAGLTIGAGELSAAQTAVCIVVFTVVAGASVIVPVVGYLAARERMAAPLDRMRSFLLEHNAAIMTVLLGVIGTVVLGGGISAL